MRTEGLDHMKIFNQPTRNQTRDHQSYGAVPQPTAPQSSNSLSGHLHLQFSSRQSDTY
jgi:hypothetical protein